MANKAIKYRLYPTTEQSILFAKTFGCCRKIWNLMLADKIAYYESTGKMLLTTPAQYKKEYPYLKEVDSLALANVQLHLQTAYRNFFRDKKIGFPKYKSGKHSRKSYTTNNQKGTVCVKEAGIRLPKLGIVKARIHRSPQEDWVVKSATVSQDGDGKYYVSVLFEFDEAIVAVPKSADKAIGLDYKSDGLYMDSNGTVGSNHKYYRESQNKLAKAQRKLKHKTAGSNNYEKQKRRIAGIYRHAANQRLDHLHKLSTGIANRYEVVCVESLNMKAMANKGFGNGRATLDNGYGMFLDMLEYKQHDRGHYFIKIDKWYPSSQICSCCGRQQKLTLADRIYRCGCGNITDRDYNAAKNIRKEGIRILLESA